MLSRIVVDTNVFVAALLSAGGANREVLRLCLIGKAIPLMGAALFHEYEDLLSRPDVMNKCPISLTERRDLYESFMAACTWVKIYLWRPNLPDEGDNHLVELGLAGHADAVVTNNVRDLRRGELRFPELRILTPFGFLQTLT